MLVGIDLGTTFSAIARLGADGRAEILTNREGERTTPSVVMFEDGSIIVGEQAKDNSVVDPYSVCQFVKRQMGKKAFSFDISSDQKYSAEDISAMILKRLKEDAENATGETIDGAVITVPAYFDDAQRKATQDAGEIAGLKVLGIINEPTAAALAYCHGQANSDGIVMVYDVGGGTFDITIMRLSDNLTKVDILSTTGNRNLGGFDFDNAIINKVIDEFKKEHNLDLEDDDVACQDLRIKAENLKKALSSRPKASLSIVSQGKPIKVEITREEFEAMIKSQIDSTKASMEIAMDDAGLKWSDISKILLVGGSTRIPAIQNMIKDLTGIEPSHELNPDEAVAMGAAYYADTLNVVTTGEKPKAEKEIKVTDVNSHSLGIITTHNGEYDIASFIIPRNTAIPASGEKEYYTLDEGQTSLKVVVVEGEDEDPEYDTVIGTTTLKLVPRPKGSPIGVMMQYDQNGIIHVRVKDNVDGADLGEMHIDRESNLSDDEIANKKEFIGGADIE
ncbi:MAG: Hsp70 family protein [Butyrivibrio sp.]|jgi:molecular chaperone DnaK|nr:Hsp70 family protein [Butyrivibrio sp.]